MKRFLILPTGKKRVVMRAKDGGSGVLFGAQPNAQPYFVRAQGSGILLIPESLYDRAQEAGLEDTEDDGTAEGDPS